MEATAQGLMEYTGKRVDDPSALQSYIDTASEIVSNYIGYPLAIGAASEIVEGRGLKKIQLRHKPLRMISSITDLATGRELYAASSSITGDYFFNNEYAEFKNITFPEGKIKVEYVFGYGFYDLPQDILSGGDAFFTDFEAGAFAGGAEGFPSYEIINGGNAENNMSQFETEPMPAVIVMTILRIAALLLAESDQNIGVSSKSFGDTGIRAFINYVNYDKYLQILSKFRLVTL